MHHSILKSMLVALVLSVMATIPAAEAAPLVLLEDDLMTTRLMPRSGTW